MLRYIANGGPLPEICATFPLDFSIHNTSRIGLQSITRKGLRINKKCAWKDKILVCRFLSQQGSHWSRDHIPRLGYAPDCTLWQIMRHYGRARGATLKVGGLTSDSKWGGWKHLFLSNSLKFPKKWGGGWSPPAPPPPRALLRYS